MASIYLTDNQWSDIMAALRCMAGVRDQEADIAAAKGQEDVSAWFRDAASQDRALAEFIEENY